MNETANEPVNAHTFTIDGKTISFTPGQTILQAALDAGHYLPYLCYHPKLKPHGSCKVCSVKIGEHITASCTALAQDGLVVQSEIAAGAKRATGADPDAVRRGQPFLPGLRSQW